MSSPHASIRASEKGTVRSFYNDVGINDIRVTTIFWTKPTGIILQAATIEYNDNLALTIFFRRLFISL